MFNEQSASRICFMISFLNRIKTIPIKLDPIHGCFYVDFWCHFHTIHHYLWLSCYTLSVLPTHMHKLLQIGNREELSYTILVWLASLAASSLFRILAFRSQGICQLVNALLRFMENFEEKFRQNHKWTLRDHNLNCLVEKMPFWCFLFFNFSWWYGRI